MKLSAPIYHLKRKAKHLSREEKIPLHEALKRISLQEGYKDWSLLAAKRPASMSAGKLLTRLEPGDLMLLGARPGQGKTLMSLELAVEAMKSGDRAVFFTLEYTVKDVLDRFHAIGAEPAQFKGLLEIDCSDAISADHMIQTLPSAPRRTLVIVDYLQLLDQKRVNPELAEQVRALKAFAQDRGLIIVFISQIDRSYDPSTKACPDVRDVRLTNPVDLQLFNKTCFLHNGEVQFQAAS
jgi:replicative DNA helicase